MDNFHIVLHVFLSRGDNFWYLVIIFFLHHQNLDTANKQFPKYGLAKKLKGTLLEFYPSLHVLTK